MKAARLKVHPDNPPLRLVRQAAEVLSGGGVILYPTDSHYALGCVTGNAKGVERIRAIRSIPAGHHLTMAIKDLSEISSYAKLGNTDFRFIKSCMPGPFTFVMRATKLVSERLVHPKRKTIGVRNIGHRVVEMLLGQLGEPLITSSFDADDGQPEEIEEMFARAQGLTDLVLDSGPCANIPTTVIDMTETPYVLLRQGAGESPSFAVGDA